MGDISRAAASVCLLLLLGVVLLQESAQELDRVGGPLAVELHHALHQHGHHCKGGAHGSWLISRCWGWLAGCQTVACGYSLQVAAPV